MSQSRDIRDFSIERLGLLRWRVLYKGKSWRNEYENVLPQSEWCPTRRWAIRKARRLARNDAGRLIQQVAPTDEAMKIPTMDARERL